MTTEYKEIVLALKNIQKEMHERNALDKQSLEINKRLLKIAEDQFKLQKVKAPSVNENDAIKNPEIEGTAIWK